MKTPQPNEYALQQIAQAFDALTAQLHGLGKSFTEDLSAIRGLSVNNQLFVGTVALKVTTNPALFRTSMSRFSVPYGNVSLWNRGSAPVFFGNVAAADDLGRPSLQPGGNIPGWLVVPAGEWISVPLAGRELFMESTAAGTISLVISTAAMPPIGSSPSAGGANPILWT